MQKIHYKVIIRKKREIKTYCSKYLNIQKVTEILEERGWEVLKVIPAGKMKV